VELGNMEIKKSVEGGEGIVKRGRRLLLLKYPEKRRWREELLKSKQPHFNERMALR